MQPEHIYVLGLPQLDNCDTERKAHNHRAKQWSAWAIIAIVVICSTTSIRCTHESHMNGYFKNPQGPNNNWEIYCSGTQSYDRRMIQAWMHGFHILMRYNVAKPKLKIKNENESKKQKN